MLANYKNKSRPFKIHILFLHMHLKSNNGQANWDATNHSAGRAPIDSPEVFEGRARAGTPQGLRAAVVEIEDKGAVDGGEPGLWPSPWG